MRAKKIFSFDEEKDAEEVITNGFPNGTIDYSIMYVIAKYFRHNFKYGAIRMERELIKFCKAHDPNFNPVTEAEAIKRWVKSAMDYELRKVECISITQNEIDFLKSVEVVKERKLLFMTLILAKALKQRVVKKGKVEPKQTDSYYIHYNNYLDIIRLAKLNNTTEVDLARMFYKYKEHVTLYSAERETLRIDYIDKNQEQGVKIEHLDKALEYYDLFFGGNNCTKCGTPIEKKSNRQTMCPNCAKEVRNQKQKELMQRRRNSVSI